jgi:glycine cleavage system H protein
MTDLRFSRDHEWVRRDGNTAVVGITDFAQKQLGDVVYVELPPIGRPPARSTRRSPVRSSRSTSC